MKELDKIMLGFRNFCETRAEFAMNADICEKLPEIPVAEPVCFAGISNGKRSTEKQASLFDAMMAEIHAEKDARTEKFMKTHYVRNDGKPILKDKRKANFSRREKYFDRDLDDRFPNKGKSMYMTIRKYRNDMAESVRRSDYDAEINPSDRRVGYNTIQRIMYNADKRMREIRAEKADKYWDVETYDDCYVVIYEDGNGYQFPYPDEYYNAKAEWQYCLYMIEKHGMLVANKKAKGECEK